jgi:hypothetical protein
MTVLHPTHDPYRFDRPHDTRLGHWFAEHVREIINEC